MVPQIVVIALFAVWAAVTVGLQIPGLRRWLQSTPLCVFIPEYRFFAPVPARGDYHLLFRDIGFDGTEGPWNEVCRIQRKHWWNAAWNPRKRERKALFDAILYLQLSKIDNTDHIMLTVPYLLLLNHICAVPRAMPTEKVQFAVVQSDGWVSSAPASWVLLSQRHRLDVHN